MVGVSLIIINYMRESLTINCLNFLERQSLKDFEIIIVDNGSPDNSLYQIQKSLENRSLIQPVKLIKLNKNSGFTAGVLAGFELANGNYIALLNNDTEPEADWLRELFFAMNKDNSIGICASKLIAYGKNVIDSAGDGFSRTLKGFKRGEGEVINKFEKQEYVFGACAGAALYRKKMLDEIGFFDEDFFLIHEDTDLNFRAQLYGWKVLYVPTAIVYHKVRSSIGKMSDLAIYYTLRNSEFVRIKNIPFGVFIRCLPEFMIGVLTEFFYFAIKHKRLRLYFKAKMDAIKMLPKMLKKRAMIMKKRKVSNSYILKILTPVWQEDFLRSKIKKFLYE